MSNDVLEAPQRDHARLEPRDQVLAVALCGTSGAAVLAQAVLDIPMSLTAPFVVLPSSVAIVAVVFVRTGHAARFRYVAERVLAGGAWGLVATLVYDAVRPGLLAVLDLDFNPFRAIPLFGSLATGRPTTDGLAITIGWIYHFWNGITFGMMFALVRREGGWLIGLAWGLGLQLLMMWAYPDLLGVRLDTPGYLQSTIVGHSVWGAVLGAGLARTAPRVSARSDHA
jgi:hypothetical protein